eukprot:PhF_6_TR42951/c0_g1_i3/m.65314
MKIASLVVGTGTVPSSPIYFRQISRWRRPIKVLGSHFQCCGLTTWQPHTSRAFVTFKPHRPMISHEFRLNLTFPSSACRRSMTTTLLTLCVVGCMTCVVCSMEACPCI